MTEHLYRSIPELPTVEGRELTGLAVPWNTIAMVSDSGGPRYAESWAPASCDRSLEQRGPGPFPLLDSQELAKPVSRWPLASPDSGRDARAAESARLESV